GFEPCPRLCARSRQLVSSLPEFCGGVHPQKPGGRAASILLSSVTARRADLRSRDRRRQHKKESPAEIRQAPFAQRESTLPNIHRHRRGRPCSDRCLMVACAPDSYSPDESKS